MIKIALTFLGVAVSWVSFGLIDTSTETEQQKLERQKNFYAAKLKELEAHEEWEECAMTRDLIFEIDARLKELAEDDTK